MIEFQRIQIHNFLAIGHANLDLKNQGLVLIEGVNKDDPTANSNGAGKSSLVDAVSWCLYGCTARGVTGDAVINSKAKSNTYVSIDVNVDGQDYYIERGRKSKALKNRVKIWKVTPGGQEDLTLGTDKATQERIETLLGCNLETFNAAVYMGQEAMPDLPGMSDKELKSILESALSIDKLDDALAIAKTRWESVAASVNSNTARIEQVDTSLNDMQRQIDWSDKHIGNLSDEIYILENEMHAEIASLETKIARENIVLDKMQIELAKLGSSTIRAAELDEAYTDIKAKKESAKQEFYKKLQLLHQKDAELSARKMALLSSAHGTATACAHCGRDYDDAEEIKTHREEAKLEISSIDKKLLLLQDKIKKLTDQAIEVDNSFDAELKKVSETKIAEQMTTASMKKDIQRAWSDINEKKAGIAVARAKYQRMLSAKREARAEADEELIKTKELQNQAKMVLDTLLKKKPELAAELEVLDKVVHVLGRKGFRGEVLDQVTPYLNAKTQYYLNWLTEGSISAVWSTIDENSKGDYVESFHIDVETASGVKGFANLSGGEKRKVRLATALALQDLVGSRAIKPIKFFVADEIDHAIDTAGLELLMGLLEEKAKSVGTMFIISHNELSDYAKNSITITKSGGISTISAP